MDKDSPLRNFIFTQHSISTFENCPVKFRKRYIENVRWSRTDSLSLRRTKLGNMFHLMARRYFLGIDPGMCGVEPEYGELEAWMSNLKKHFPLEPGHTYLPEYRLRAALGEAWLEANFDLLVMKNDSVEIWDWKTGSSYLRDGAGEGKLGRSLQTVVYMFVLGERYGFLTGNGGSLCQISMHYWRPEPPGSIDDISYDGGKHDCCRAELEERINRILDYDYGAFKREMFSRHCKSCEFNRICAE